MSKKLFYLIVGLTAVSLLAGNVEAQTLGIGTTKRGGNATISAAISKVVSSKTDRQMRPLPRAGTQLYIAEVNAGEIEFGVANAIQYTFAMNGTVLFKGRPNPNLRMVGSLVPFLVGLVVKDDSDIKTIADLKGRRVPSGVKSSPSALLTLRSTLANAGLTMDDVERVPTTSMVTMWNGFEAGKFETTVTAVGTGRNKQIAAKVGKIRFLNIDPSPEAYARSLAILPTSEPTLVKPAPGLTGIDKPTYVIGYYYTLFTHKDVPVETVYKVARAVYESQDELRATSAVWREFDAKKLARKFTGVQYHPGAIKLYKDKGIW